MSFMNKDIHIIFGEKDYEVYRLYPGRYELILYTTRKAEAISMLKKISKEIKLPEKWIQKL